MSADRELYLFLKEPMANAARKQSKLWHGILEPDEIASELWLMVADSPATEEKLEGADADLLDDLLNRMASRVCIKERDSYEHFSGQYRYSVGEVKDIADRVYTSVLESGCESLDFENGLAQLENINPAYFEVFRLRYKDGVTLEEKADRVRCTRAEAKLCELMNQSRRQREAGYTQGPGTKPVVPRGVISFADNQQL